MLSKVQYTVQGSISFNGNDINLDRTTTVEIKAVGSTKVEIPKTAKEAMS